MCVVLYAGMVFCVMCNELNVTILITEGLMDEGEGFMHKEGEGLMHEQGEVKSWRNTEIIHFRTIYH